MNFCHHAIVCKAQRSTSRRGLIFSAAAALETLSGFLETRKGKSPAILQLVFAPKGFLRARHGFEEDASQIAVFHMRCSVLGINRICVFVIRCWWVGWKEIGSDSLFLQEDPEAKRRRHPASC
jgi:hypothetical protein